MNTLSRRRFVIAGAAAGAFGGAPFGRAAFAVGHVPTILEVASRTIEVAGKAAKVYGILQSDGAHGLSATSGGRFRVRLVNRIREETLVHWHGLAPPSDQDGVPGLSQPALAPGGAYEYDFPLAFAGTFWMHSHLGLQEQNLLAAPLIVRDPKEADLDEQDVVVLLHDFTFRDPEEILAELRGGHGGHAAAAAPPASSPGGHGAMGHGMMGHGSPAPPAGGGHGAMGHGMMGRGSLAPAAGAARHTAGVPHLNDVEFDAYLANDRTLDDPEVFRVEPGGIARLRLINGAAATNFWIDLGGLEGDLIAVDGHAVAPLRGRRFEIAISQRLDIRLRLPAGQGAHPVFAEREGERARTGFVLATKAARVHRLAAAADAPAGAVGLDLERRLRAAAPLPARAADRLHRVELGGGGADYAWFIDGRTFEDHAPLPVRKGERVEIAMRNATEMAHPMHLHGHPFQVVEIDGTGLAGAVRDSVMVPPAGSVRIAFDADNPGHWAFHCHHLYHMVAGMMASVKYEDA